MATVDIDTLEDISSEERHGALVRLTRSLLVRDLAPADYANGDKYRILDDALTAVAGEGFTTGSKCPDHDNLLLGARMPEVIDKANVRVTLVYEHFYQSGMQRLDAPSHGELYYGTSTSLDTVETENDALGTQITVSHEYPSTHKKYPGETITQGGTISVQVPRRVKTLDGLFECKNADALVDLILNHVNSLPWFGKAAGTWMCTAGDHSPYDLENARRGWAIHKFHFEFVYNADGWQPGVVYRDEETGRPPPDLDADGAKTITYYPSVNFGSFFSSWSAVGDPEPD